MRSLKKAQKSRFCRSMAEQNSSQSSFEEEHFHRWDLTPAAAAGLQQHLAGKVIRQSVGLTNRKQAKIRTVAGVDCSYDSGAIRAAVVVMRYANLETIAEAVTQQPVVFPYRSGLLAFREGPAVLDAISQLPLQPDLLIFDGHGLAHPRRFGIACHIGLLTGIASIGCAKTRLVGVFEPPASERGSYGLLKDKGEIIGAAVRTRTDVAPVFVSIGHCIDLADSIAHVLHCCRGYRLPETTRRADRLAASCGKDAQTQ